MKTDEALLLLRGDIELELLARNEYLAAENEILKTKLDKPVWLTDPERIRLSSVKNDPSSLSIFLIRTSRTNCPVFCLFKKSCPRKRLELNIGIGSI
jgi:hypothetical protein